MNIPSHTPERLEAKPSKRELKVVSHALKLITKSFASVPESLKKSTESIADFEYCIRRSDWRREQAMYYWFLRDGVAVGYVNDVFLETRSNRFRFPSEGEPDYHRQPISTDCQAIPSRRLDVIGVHAIAVNAAATEQLLLVADEVAVTARLGWENTTPSQVRMNAC